MLGNLAHYLKKNKLDLYFTRHLKINIKWIEKDLNMKDKTVKVIEENIKKYSKSLMS